MVNVFSWRTILKTAIYNKWGPRKWLELSTVRRKIVPNRLKNTSPPRILRKDLLMFVFVSSLSYIICFMVSLSKVKWIFIYRLWSLYHLCYMGIFFVFTGVFTNLGHFSQRCVFFRQHFQARTNLKYFSQEQFYYIWNDQNYIEKSITFQRGVQIQYFLYSEQERSRNIQSHIQCQV